jgi:hypothetical protein
MHLQILLKIKIIIVPFETKILFQNIRSCKNKIHLLENITNSDSNLKIICLSETWITKQKLDLLKLDEYVCASVFYREYHVGGGVCIFTGCDLEYIERRDICNLSVELVFEVCCIEILKLNIIIINIYWPMRNRNSDTFFTSLENMLKILIKKDSQKNIMIGGDFNIDFLNKCHHQSNLSTLMSTYNFTQQINEPTRVTSTSSTCLDLLFTNFNLKNLNTDVKIYDYGLSDHKGIIVNIQCAPHKSPTYYTKKRIYKENRTNLFKEHLKYINWHNLFVNNNSVNENYNIFLQKINEIHNNCIPIINIKFKNIKRKTWLTKGIRISCKHKRLIKILISQYKNPILEKYYKQYSRHLKNIVISSKKLCNINRIKNSRNINKTIWSIVKEKTNKNSKRSVKNLSLNINNTLVQEPHLVADAFNEYFVSVGEHDAAGEPFAAPSVPVSSFIQNSFYLKPVDIKEVIQIIKKLKNKMSFGFDEIPPMLIKKCSQELALPLTLLINQSFNEGVVPDKLKISVVKPIFKSGDTTKTDNYRPIALLPSFSKIFETAMTNRLSSFCEKFNIIDDNQNGFRRNRSTTIAVFKYNQKILDIINKKNYAVGILLDMSKAYDRVLPNVLLKKLYSIGIRGVAHDWIRSYFKNRTQFVEIQHKCSAQNTIVNVRSERAILTKSIPQGSVIGCLLFLIYINNIPDTIKDRCILFADDISVILPIKNDSEVNNKLQTVTNDLISWLRGLNLILNLKKTKLMIFKPYQKKPLTINFSIDNIKLECVSNFPLLGIKIDSNLNWKYHTEHVLNKLSRFTYALYELKRSTDTNTAKMAYHAYAHSWLRYGIPLWGNGTDVHKLLVAQKRCIRILANINIRDSCKPYFIQYKILTVISLYILESCKLVRKNIDLYDAADDTDIHMKLRKRNKFILPKTTLSLIGSGPYSMSIKLYNALPSQLRRIENYKKFVMALNEYLVSKCYYTLSEYYVNVQ